MLTGSCKKMEENNCSTRTLYAEALQDPTSLSEETLQQLIDTYPYSQPLHWAYARFKYRRGDTSQPFSSALLYAESPSWLFTLVSANVPQIHKVVEEPEDLSEGDEDNGLDGLLAHGAAADYFMFEEKVQVMPEEELVGEEGGNAVDSDDVSLYNDDLMPYSFRWWLHKTRLEHVQTYQPFAQLKLPTPEKGQFDFNKLDEAILDQQIKESIIHFQDPEAKLSEEVKKKPVEVISPKKTDKIIEQFILEEPIIQPPTAESLNNENMARRSAEDNYVLVTETLANIYLDQGLFPKAIEVFNKLILIYPEKKSYFGDRIKEIEKNL